MWNEVVTPTGDAGSITDEAQETFGSGILGEIRGILEPSQQGDKEDVDVFKIKITDTSLFSAKVVAPSNGSTDPFGPTSDLVDSFLFIFDSTGRTVIADNNSPEAIGGGALSEIEAGALATLARGDYFIAVTSGLFPDLPIDKAGNPLFDGSEIDGDFDSPPFLVPGNTASGSIAPISTEKMEGWDFGADGPTGGIAIGAENAPYSIILTSAEYSIQNVIPEPTSWAIWGLFGLTAIGLRRRRTSDAY